MKEAVLLEGGKIQRGRGSARRMTISPRIKSRSLGTRMKRSAHCVQSGVEADGIAENPTHGTSLCAAAVLKVLRLTHSYSSEGRYPRRPTLSTENWIPRDCGMEDQFLKPLERDRAGKTCASSYLHLEVVELVHAFVPETCEGDDGQDVGDKGEGKQEKNEPRLTGIGSKKEDNAEYKDVDAQAFWKAAKETLREEKEKYEQLLEVVQDFGANNINLASIVQKVKILLADHCQLFLGFNAFLPQGYQITEEEEEEDGQERREEGDGEEEEDEPRLTSRVREDEDGDNEENKDEPRLICRGSQEDGNNQEEEEEPRLTSSGERKKATYTDAQAYWKEAKELLKEETEKFEMLLEVVRDFATKKIDPASTVQKLKVLLVDHRKLLLGLNVFLPTDYQITEEEEEHVECGSCGQSIKGDALGIVCYTCSNKFHCKCVHYTPTQAKNTEKYKCQSCHDSFCGICRQVYTHEQLWIKCYYCHKGFHCKCVHLTQNRADRIERYRCAWCSSHRSYR